MKRLSALATLAVLLAGCASAPEKDPVTVRLDDLDRRLERIERVMANQSLLDLAQQIQALQAEVRSIRGALEEEQHASENTRNQQRNLYSDLDRRLQALETSVAPSPLDAGPQTGVLPVPAGSDRANYQAAFDLLKGGNYDKATAAFQQFLRTFPDSALADNAQYWLGESYYVTRNYPEALKAFRKVVDSYPNSRKLADAWLKIGYTQYELKAWAPARQALTQVVRDYKDSGAATEAQKRLEKMTAEGH
jgi:tol-pal system protein YbgF